VGVLSACASRDDALPLLCSLYKELLRSTPSIYKRNALLKERYLKSFLMKVKKKRQNDWKYEMKMLCLHRTIIFNVQTR